jgi:hypothetical protein
MKTIKTISLSTALAVAFLSAGAFAGVQAPFPKFAASPKITNVTVIRKSSAWPLKGQISTEACTLHRCIAI